MPSATTRSSTLSLHDALPISGKLGIGVRVSAPAATPPSIQIGTGEGLQGGSLTWFVTVDSTTATDTRSEEHTSELQSQSNLVCRLLLEKKKNIKTKS